MPPELTPILLDLAVVPSELLVSYMFTKVLALRSVAAFWALRIAFIALGVVRSLFASVLYSLFLVVLTFAIPLALSKGPFSRRLITVAAVLACLFVTEALSSMWWALSTGDPVFGYDAALAYLPEFLQMHAAHLVVMAAMFSGLYALMERLFRNDVGRGLRLFAAFPLMQLVLLGLVLMGGRFVGGSGYYMVGSMLSVLCLAADALLFVSIDRYEKRRRKEQEAAMLQERLDSQLARYREVEAEMQRAARLRHDLRNHLQVVFSLSERGEGAVALEHLEAMRVRLHEGSEAEKA